MNQQDERRRRLNPRGMGLLDVMAGGVEILDSQLLMNQPDLESVWRHEDSALVLGVSGVGVLLMSGMLWRIR